MEFPMDSRNKKPKPNILLRSARESQNFTLQDVADKLYDMGVEEGRRSGINADTVGRWERGLSKPEAHYRAKLCALYGKSAAALGLVEQPEVSASAPAPLVTATRTPVDNEEHPVASSLQDILLRGETPADHQEVPVVLIHTHQAQAIDLLMNASDVPPQQQLGALLALEANNLVTFFDEGWSVNEVLEVLRVVLPVVQVQAMAKMTRRTFGRTLLQFGAAAAISGIPVLSGRHISEEARIKLHHALGESIAAGWKSLYSVSNAQLLTTAHALLFLVQQNHALLYSKARSLCYTGVYGQIGMAHHFQEQDEEALRAYRSSYIAALEAGEPWYVAQSLICQADSYHALYHYGMAIEAIEEALRIIGTPTDETMTQARAHLLTCWADNAMMLEHYRITQEKLDEAEAYLDQIAPNEEFDQASWLLIDGKFALKTGRYSKAKNSFEKALKGLPDHWVLRRVMTAIGLAMALAHMRERKESIAVAEKLIPMVRTVDAQLTNRWFHEYLQQDLLGAFPADDQVHKFVADAYKQLPQLASPSLPRS